MKPGSAAWAAQDRQDEADELTPLACGMPDPSEWRIPWEQPATQRAA